MKQDNQNKVQLTLPFSTICIILTIIFVVLKLCGVITWGWVYVFMPLIAVAGLTVVLIGIVVICKILIKIIDKQNK